VDHVVYVDAKAKELEQLLSGTKSMIIRGASGRKIPFDRVQSGDLLYLINNNAEGVIKAKAQVKHVMQLGKLSETESTQMIEEYQPKLQLTAAQMKRWAGKRYLVLITVEPATPVEPFAIDKSAYGNMDDWLSVGDIATVRRAAPQLVT